MPVIEAADVFLACRLLGYNSYRGVIKPSSCLKNKNGKVKDEITTALFCLAKWRWGGGGGWGWRVIVFVSGLHFSRLASSLEAGVKRDDFVNSTTRDK